MVVILNIFVAAVIFEGGVIFEVIFLWLAVFWVGLGREGGW